VTDWRPVSSRSVEPPEPEPEEGGDGGSRGSSGAALIPKSLSTVSIRCVRG